MSRWDGDQRESRTTRDTTDLLRVASPSPYVRGMTVFDRAGCFWTCLVLLSAGVVLMVPVATASVATWTAQADFLSGTFIGLDPSSQPGNLLLARDSRSWEKLGASPVFTPGPLGAWDESSVNAVHVLFEAGGYKMWYSGCQGIACSIGYATSSDGVSWSRYGGNPILPLNPTGWDETIGNPYVIKEESLYRMWFAGNSVLGTIQIGYATSPDGIQWTKHPTNPVLRPYAGACDQGSISSPVVLREDSGYTLWYSAQEGDFIYRMGRATSPDGVNWSKDPSNPILSPELPWEESRVHPVSVVRTTEVYELFYTAGFNTYHVGRAVSSDGVTWTRTPTYPVLSPGPFETWDGGRLGSASVLVLGPQWKMWYVGGSELPRYSVPPDRLSVGLAATPSYEIEGRFLSEVFASGSTWTLWQRIEWSATVPPGATLSVFWRLGNSAAPDSMWSDWSLPRSSSPIDLELPRSQHIQIMVSFERGSSPDTPVLSEISITFEEPPSALFPGGLLLPFVAMAVVATTAIIAYLWHQLRLRPMPPPQRSTREVTRAAPLSCERCGHANEPTRLFCRRCGQGLPRLS